MSLSNDLKEFAQGFQSSYKMFSDQEDKRKQREETERYHREGTDVQREHLRGAPAADIAGAEEITKKYQTGTGTPGGGEGTRVPSTKQQDALAADYHGYLTDKLGYSPQAAAGILGNMKQESSFDPLASGDKGTAHGLFQWRGDRFTNLQNFAANQGKSWKDPYVQLDYMHNELTKGGYGKAYQALQSAKTAGQAADGFALHFERPKGANTGDPNQIDGIGARRGYANQVLGFRKDVAAAPRTEPAVTATAIPPPKVAPQAPGQTAVKPEKPIELQPIAAAEPEPDEDDLEPTAFGAAGGAVPDPTGNYGAPRAFTQAPSQQSAPVASGASQVGGGGGWQARRVGMPAPGSTGSTAIPMPAGVGYGVGQTTPGQQALIDRRQAKATAAAAAAAAAAAPKASATPTGNQWEGRYGQRPEATNPTMPAGYQRPGMTTEQLEAMPNGAFANPQAFAAMHPGTENYVRWRVGEDAWATGQRQQDQWRQGQYQQNSGRAAGGPVERSYAEGGLVERSYAAGGAVEPDEYETGYMEGEAPTAIPAPNQDRDIAREAMSAPTPKEKEGAKTEKRKAEHEDDSAEAAKARLAERARARQETLRVSAQQPEKTPVQAQVGKPTGPPDRPEDAPVAGPPSAPTPSQTRGRGATTPIPVSPVVSGRTAMVGAEGEVVPTTSPPPPGPGDAGAIPPPGQARGAYGGRMGAPTGVNAPPSLPPAAAGPVAAQPITDSEGNPIAMPEQGPPAPPPAIPLPDQPPAMAASADTSQAGTPSPMEPPRRPDMAATGSVAPDPTPGKPTPGQKVINSKGQPDHELAGPSLERGLKLKEKQLQDKKGKGPAIGHDPAMDAEHRNYGRGTDVMSNQDYQSLAQTVDPHNQLNAAERNIAMYQELQDYWLAKGNPAKAAEASLGLTMYNRRAAQASGGMALAALSEKQGQPPSPQDVLRGAQWLSKAYNSVPNNQHLLVVPNKEDPTKIDYVVLDGAGKELQNGTADSGQLSTMAQGAMSGAAFDQSLWDIVNARRGGGGKAAAAGAPKETDAQRKAARNVEFEKGRTDAVEAGKGLKGADGAIDPEKQKAFDEKISRLRELGGHDTATDKAIRQVYVDAGLTPPETTTSKEGVKAKTERETKEAAATRKKAIDDAEAAGDKRKALDLNLQSADEAFARQKVQSSGKPADYDTALDDAKITDPAERTATSDAATEIMSRNKGATPAQAVRAVAAMKAAAANRTGAFNFDEDGRVRIPGMESRPLFISGKMIRSFMTGGAAPKPKAATGPPPSTAPTPRYQPNQPAELGA